MEQTTLVSELYRACIARDHAKQRELLRKHFEMVFRLRSEGKLFDATWTIVRG